MFVMGGRAWGVGIGTVGRYVGCCRYNRRFYRTVEGQESLRSSVLRTSVGFYCTLREES